MLTSEGTETQFPLPPSISISCRFATPAMFPHYTLLGVAYSLGFAFFILLPSHVMLSFSSIHPSLPVLSTPYNMFFYSMFVYMYE